MTLDEVMQLPDSRILVPCGKCSACRRQKALMWRGRLLREYDDFCTSHGYDPYSNLSLAPVYFVTLTVTDKWRPLVEDSPSKIMRWFFEDLRAACGKSPRHWFIVEYGDYKRYTGRIHFHGIFFGLNGLTFSTIRRCWRFGDRVDITRVRSRACMTYVTKYITKSNNHALVSAQTGKFPYLSKIFASASIGNSLYVNSSSRIVSCAISMRPITVSFRGFDYSVPYYYIRKICDAISPSIMKQRRILNSFWRQMLGWCRYFAIPGFAIANNSVNFSSGLSYLPERLRRYAHLAQLESNPQPPSIDSAVRSVRHLLKIFDCYEYDYLRPPSAISEIKCALGSI